MLMSFVGVVRTLMEETGLAQILESVFGGVSIMLTRKKFPLNRRAICLVTEEFLRDIVGQSRLTCLDDLLTALQDITSVLVMMLYVRTEKGNWPLHLQMVKLMMPYFFAPGHSNYARYGL